MNLTLTHRAIMKFAIAALLVTQCCVAFLWSQEATTFGRGFVSAYVAPFGIIAGLITPLLILLLRRPQPSKRSYDVLILSVTLLVLVLILMIIYTMSQMAPQVS